MDVLVVGAHKGLGAQVMSAGKEAGHSMVAYGGDVLDLVGLCDAVPGHDAVISTLGPHTHKDVPPDFFSRCTHKIVMAIKGTSARRLIMVSTAVIGHPEDRMGLFHRYQKSRLAPSLLNDRRSAELIAMETGMDWTLIRPARLTDGPKTGQVHTDPTAKIDARSRVSRLDAAHVIVQALEDPATFGRILTLQNKRARLKRA